jgi:hypothetical protein
MPQESLFGDSVNKVRERSDQGEQGPFRPLAPTMCIRLARGGWQCQAAVSRISREFASPTVGQGEPSIDRTTWQHAKWSRRSWAKPPGNHASASIPGNGLLRTYQQAGRHVSGCSWPLLRIRCMRQRQPKGIAHISYQYGSRCSERGESHDITGNDR